MPIAKVGVEFKASADGNASLEPVTVGLTNGGFVTVWGTIEVVKVNGENGEENVPFGSVFGRVYLPNGTPSLAFALDSTNPGNQSLPSVTALADGRFVAIWTTNAQGGGDSSGSSVRGRIFNANGEPEGSDFLVNKTTAGSEVSVKVTALSNGGFVATYLSDATQTVDDTDCNIYSRVFNKNGVGGLEYQVNADDETVHLSFIRDISVAPLAGGKFVTTWQSYDDRFGELIGILGQISTAGGEPSGNSFVVSSTLAIPSDSPSVTTLANGRFVAVWTAIDPSVDGDLSAISGRVFNADGTPYGKNFVVNASAAGLQIDPTVTALADGRFVASWATSHSNNTVDLRLRVFNADGTSAGNDGDFVVTTGLNASPSIAALTDGRFVLSWLSAENGVEQKTIQSQIFDPKVFNGTAKNDIWNGGELADKINGGAGNDMLFGKGGVDTIKGGDGNDTLDGGAGTDALDGGAGNDTYVMGSGSDKITDASGTDTITSTIARSLVSYAAIENLTLLGTGTINGTGNALSNRITGNSGMNTLSGGDGNDTLDGGAGADTLDGGAGHDTYVLGLESDKVIDASGVDTITSTITRSLAEYTTIERLKLVGTGNINGTGNALANIITGNAGNNVLYGAGGNDTLDGGAGNDTYVLGSTNDVVKDASGVDTITSSISRSLTGYATIENLRLTGVADIKATGNSLANILTGNAGKNTLDGGSGNDTLNGAAGVDTLIGGSGNDTYVLGAEKDTVTDTFGVDTITSTINRSLANYSKIENLTLAGTGNINGAGDSFANMLTGNSGVNTLSDGAGNDTLDGGAGTDTLDGGAGNDTYVLGSESDKIKDSAGVDTTTSTISRSLAPYGTIENLTLLGSTHINGTGNSLANTITGNTGNNSLDGGAGTDILIGGAGNDTYVLGAANDTVSDSSGVDTITSTIARSLALHTKIDNLTLLGNANINGIGNDLANTIIGNAGVNALTGGKGNDTLDGGAGTDTLDGGEGNDIFILGSGNDTVIDAAGRDTITSTISRSLLGYTMIEDLVLAGTGNISGTGNTLANRITGNSGKNTLSGGDGNDMLDGGVGADTLDGGAGNDTYALGGESDMILDASGTDAITSTVTRSLAGYGMIENLTLLGTVNISGTGNDLNNRLTGNSGKNTLSGGIGNDTLIGGAGNDKLIGGTGNDAFVFNTAPNASSNVDTITDFSTAGDMIRLDSAVFTGLGATGAMGSGLFEEAFPDDASTASVRIIYDSINGGLYYDADGSGSRSAVLFANIGEGLDLTHERFFIF